MAIDIVAVNDAFIDCAALCYLLSHDPLIRNQPSAVEVQGGRLRVGHAVIACYSQPHPQDIPWGSHSVDWVVDTSSHFTTSDRAALHLEGGAASVLVAAASPDLPPMMIGAGPDLASQRAPPILSTGAHAAVAIVPVLEALAAASLRVVACSFVVVRGPHARASVVDEAARPGVDRRVARSALASVVPAASPAARTVAQLCPSLRHAVGGTELSVPVGGTACAVHLTLTFATAVSKDAIDAAIAAAARGRFAGVLGVAAAGTVSADVAGSPLSAAYDAGVSQLVTDTTAQLLVWSDFSCSYAARTLELVEALGVPPRQRGGSPRCARP